MSITKRQIRSAKKLKNTTKQKGKYPILLKQVIEVSDIILEILDARFVKEMQNKEIEKLIADRGKKIIYVLNKSDLTRKRDKRLNPRIFVSCIKNTGITELRNKIKEEASKSKKTGRFNRVQVGVIGYPNTGKSSLINLLIGRTSAKTGSDAGFTKGIQKLKLTEDIQLLDSPGVIPSDEYSMTSEEKIAQHVKVGGRSYSQIKNPEIALNEIVKSNKEDLEKFYKIKFNDAEDLIEKIGRKKGFLKKGNEVNSDKAARTVLKDWQLGNIEA
ncbi:MAG: 50S ribosome-binding GTPase [Nanoarchaeota archaeon]|nr:50S ribosome-binding GTPase [Nanoarchaeota archaeon]MBU4116716.1 50S ribosome-binding GTPase [Nanoarchaeota archaeon]